MIKAGSWALLCALMEALRDAEGWEQMHLIIPGMWHQIPTMIFSLVSLTDWLRLWNSFQGLDLTSQCVLCVSLLYICQTVVWLIFCQSWTNFMPHSLKDRKFFTDDLRVFVFLVHCKFYFGWILIVWSIDQSLSFFVCFGVGANKKWKVELSLFVSN